DPPRARRRALAHRAQRAELPAPARGPVVPLAAAGPARRRLGAGRAHGQRDHRLARRAPRARPRPVQPSGGAARPARRPALHGRDARGVPHPRDR
ncbi:MAG: CDP-diacylglycerol--glycerol-3-phosphate 3-phosphatidyltransferase, partial [uncultured Actinomycetospora sp.]